MSELPAQATRHELALGALEHYEKLSTASVDWNSIISKAIKLWEKEPELNAEIERLQSEVATLRSQQAELIEAGNEMSKYLSDTDCEYSIDVRTLWSVTVSKGGNA